MALSRVCKHDFVRATNGYLYCRSCKAIISESERHRWVWVGTYGSSRRTWVWIGIGALVFMLALGFCARDIVPDEDTSQWSLFELQYPKEELEKTCPVVLKTYDDAIERNIHREVAVYFIATMGDSTVEVTEEFIEGCRKFLQDNPQ